MTAIANTHATAPETAPSAQEQATEIVRIALALSAAADVRNVREQQLIAAELRMACRRFQDLAIAPVPLVAEPAAELGAELPCGRYRIRIDEQHLVLSLDDGADHAVVGLDANHARQLITSLARVLLAMEGGRG